ncbi:MAG: hypothetical protein MRY21_07055 [Simkaniaceae bacterium]|nr:hypothetical protein [Simkaniaceae bacterium]
MIHAFTTPGANKAAQFILSEIETSSDLLEGYRDRGHLENDLAYARKTRKKKTTISNSVERTFNENCTLTLNPGERTDETEVHLQYRGIIAHASKEHTGQFINITLSLFTIGTMAVKPRCLSTSGGTFKQIEDWLAAAKGKGQVKSIFARVDAKDACKKCSAIAQKLLSNPPKIDNDTMAFYRTNNRYHCYTPDFSFHLGADDLEMIRQGRAVFDNKVKGILGTILPRLTHSTPASPPIPPKAGAGEPPPPPEPTEALHASGSSAGPDTGRTPVALPPGAKRSEAPKKSSLSADAKAFVYKRG